MESQQQDPKALCSHGHCIDNGMKWLDQDRTSWAQMQSGPLLHCYLQFVLMDSTAFRNNCFTLPRKGLVQSETTCNSLDQLGRSLQLFSL